MYYLINITWTYSDDNHVIIVNSDKLKEFDFDLFKKIQGLTEENSRGYTNLPCIFLSINDIGMEFEDELESLAEPFPVQGTIVNAIEISICD